ncbi:MAG TPA: (Fe-S)-binding protein, partial [Candidatus Krumholzibacterium sp.]|nr:(Fe-S)-binding protein [Candidatus Krumholzibacterium sp.]
MTENDNIRDITGDLLLCNRCGKCRSVCPIYDVLREEWGGARGKIELAEAFFRGDVEDASGILEAFDLCLQCMTCEENCPSGMRAEEVVMAVRAEMARRGLIPWYKRLALRVLNGMDSFAFRMMRAMGFTRKVPLHGYTARNPFRPLFQLLGWRRDRVLPLPARRPFLGNHPERFTADRAELEGLDRIAPDSCEGKARDLLELVIPARRRNLEKRKTAYYFIGHTVNHFFPEEAESIVLLLNMLGIDVIVPADQLCCGAPHFYAGDIGSARAAAGDVIEGFGPYSYDWIVTSCSSGGRMLRHEFPRLLDIGGDGFFDVEWDSGDEVFRRRSGSGEEDAGLKATADRYREKVEGRALDINELVAMVLGLDGAGSAAPTGGKVVTYHQPCHLGRGQGVSWQPEAILRLLPGWDYVRMSDADRCCGGGGSFTFTHSDVSTKVAERKALS